MDLEVKIKRFVELSLEFSVDSSFVYGTKFLTSSFVWTENVDAEETTPLKKFVKECAGKVKKAERFEEYLELQKQLTKYFTAKEELNK